MPDDSARTARELLTSHPRARMAALNELGLFVPMPPSVPITSGQLVIDGHSSVLDFVTSDDVVAVADAFRQVRDYGHSQVEVRPLTAPDITMTVHFLDARSAFGVFLALVVGEGAAHISDERGSGDALRPRLSITRQDELGTFLHVDQALTSILGHTDLTGVRSVDLVHPDDAPRAVGLWVEMLGTPGCSRRMQLRQRHVDGRWVWFEVTLRNLLNDPAVRSVVVEAIDISDEMAAHETLVAQEILLRRLTDSLPVGVAQLDGHGRIVHRNPQLDMLLGHPEAETLEELLCDVADDDAQGLAEAIRAAVVEEDGDVEITALTGAAVRRFQVLLRGLPDASGGPSGLIVCVSDVTEPARLRDQLRHRATFDPLTGCHNRASLLVELDLALAGTRAGRRGVAVQFIDLDGFKDVNDRLGHAAGDTLLRDIGQCLRTTVRDGDVVGRFGGDEFVVLHTGAGSGQQGLDLAQRVSAALGQGFRPGPRHEAVASIGVAWTGGPGADDAGTLLSRADAAMYRSKARGDGCPVLA